MKKLVLILAFLLLGSEATAVPSEVVGGTQTATIGTEHTLTTQTVARNYILVVDTANMASGDILELRIRTRVRTGETLRLAYLAVYSGAQEEPIKYSVPVPANVEFQATLRQTAGTGRTYVWAVLSLD